MIILAPMQGLTELPFRKAYYQTFGNAIDLAVSPFLSLTHGNLCLANKKIHDVLPKNNIDSIPVVPQILGSEIKEFIDLANRLNSLGYNEINWNIGCPVPRVAHKKRGSGLLPYPNIIRNVLKNITEKTPVQISIKMRLGYYSDDEIFDLIPILNDFPIKNITIHPRTGIEMYNSNLHLNCLKKIIPLLKHKIIFNGEIKNINDYNFIKTQFPNIQNFMIGRGAISNPLLPLEIKNIEVDNRNLARVKFVSNLFTEIQQLNIPPNSQNNKIKEYWGYIGKGLNNIPKQVLDEPLYCQTPIETCSKIDKILKTL